MATATFSAPPDNTSDATFRVWASAMSNAIKAVGFVQTADTGQPNWTTVTKPAAGTRVYEFFAFADTLQATAPLYLRIGYGSSSTGTASSISILVGKGTTGSGALTSTFGSEKIANGTGATVSAGTWYVASGTGSRLIVVSPLTQGAQSALLIGAERAFDSAGNPVATGGILFAKNTTAGPVYQQFNYANPAAALSAFWPQVPSNTAVTSLAVAGSAPLFASTHVDGYGGIWQSRAMLAYAAADAGAGVPITVTGWGTYLPLGANHAYVSQDNYAIAWS